MTDRSVIRFAASDASMIADVLRTVLEGLEILGVRDSTNACIVGDFIEALETDDCIEIVDDEDMLIVED
jgi:hypothetical protein